MNLPGFAWAAPVFRTLKAPARLAALAAAGALFLAGSTFRVFDVYEYQTYDWRFALRPRPPVSDRIVLIDIWDDSLEQIGAWPFHRGYHAKLIEALDAAGAKMVGLDILFVEPREGDADLARAAAVFGGVYFSEVFEPPAPGRGSVSSGAIAPLLGSLRGVARGVGHVNAVADRDGKRRRVTPVIEAEGRARLHLGVLMAADFLGVPREEVRFDRGGDLRLGKRIRIPADSERAMLVSFAAKWTETFTHVSYVEVLKSYAETLAGKKPGIDPGFLKDKVCFVGLTATGTHDINPVPLEPAYPQVGIHANVFNGIITGNFLRRLPRETNASILVLVAAVAAMLTRIPMIFLSVSSAAVSLAFFAAAAVFLFSFGGVWIDLFYPAAGFVGIYLSGIVKRTMGEKRRRELMESELSIASDIQRSFLPSSLPESPLLDLAVYMKPARHVGGDLYAMLRIDENRLGIMLGDVSGKGTPAALFMAKTVSEFKFNSRGSADPARVLTNLNESLAGDASSGLFVTTLYAVFDERARTALVSNGGHLPLLKVTAGGETGYLLPDGGMPIGLMQGIEFSNLSIELPPGDIVVFYTDGISEAKNTRREDFEGERLAAAVKGSRHLAAREIQKKILSEIEKFVGHAPQHDDMTLIVMKSRDV